MIPVGLYEKALPAGWCWERRLAATAETGYDFAEISIDETGERLTRLEWKAAERAALRRAIANSGVRIVTMCLSALRTYPLGSHTPEVRRQGLEILHKAIGFAADVGVGIVQVPGYDVFGEPSDAETASWLLEGLHQGAEWAGQACLMLGLENVDVAISESIHATMRLLAAVNSPWFQLYPDMANVAAAGFYPPHEFMLAKDHIVAVHVKDGIRNTIRGVPFGEGIVPFAETFNVLRECRFRGPLVVEMWSRLDRTGDPFGAARAARGFVRPYQEVLDDAGRASHDRLEMQPGAA